MKVNIIGTIFILILCVLVIYAMYIMMYYSFDKTIGIQNETLASKLANGKLEALLNGSGINNIPNLNIITTNVALSKANACGKGPVYIGKTGTDKDCVRTCANSTASVINVADGETYIYESSVLHSGANCIIGPRPECNMKTSFAMMTINSIICRSKFPDLLGGSLGTSVVACNNRQITDPQNYLWDYKYNIKFNPLTTNILDTNEILNDGSFRFRCKFNGYDIRQNQYIQHPNNRFQPFRNYCASEIYAAHPNVKIVMNTDGTFKCDCGEFNETRVKNIDPLDNSSLCSNLTHSDTLEHKAKRLLTIPYRCFTLFSHLDDVGKYLPCPNDQFTREGSQYGSIKLEYTTTLTHVIEHPMYNDMNGSGEVIVMEPRGE